MRKSAYFTYMAQRNRSNRLFWAVMSVFSLFCQASFIYFAVIGDVRSGLMSFMFSLLPLLVYAVEKWLKLIFPAPSMMMVLFIAMGSILGAGYDLYTLVPCFDTILHVISGFVFACLGFGIFQKIVGNADNKKSFWACLLFGFALSLAIGLVWELFEYMGTALFRLDMQEDTIINGFSSYLLAGTHTETFNVDGIVQTVIYISNGHTITIDGYLDIGLIDTIEDMAVCFFGAVAYMLAIGIDRSKKKVLYRALIPQVAEIVRFSNEEYVLEPFSDTEAELPQLPELCDI